MSNIPRPFIYFLPLAMLLAASGHASAQHAMPAPRDAAPARDASNATTHSRVSDGDRVFLRSAAGLLVRDAQLARLGDAQASSAELRRFASAWKTDAETLDAELHRMAERSKLEIPKDMTDESREGLRALQGQSGKAFDRAFIQQSRSALGQQNKLFQDSIRQMEKGDVRDWAERALARIKANLARAERADPG